MLVHLSKNINHYVDDPGAFHLAGHSVGGHIAVFLASTDWLNGGCKNIPPIKSTLSISGIFDLQPVIYLERNNEIGLSQKGVDRLFTDKYNFFFCWKLIVGCGFK